MRSIPGWSRRALGAAARIRASSSRRPYSSSCDARHRSVVLLRTKGGYEVDVVTRSGLVQACASIAEPATREREVRALREAMAALGQETATIVTLTTDEEIRVAEGTIRVVPMWRWAIERAVAESAAPPPEGPTLRV